MTKPFRIFRPYLRLRLVQWRVARKRNPWLFLWDALRWLILLRVLVTVTALAVWYRTSPLWEMLTRPHPPGAILAGGILVGVACAQAELPLVTLFPLEPFVRFMSYRGWVARSLVYPLLSPTFLVLATVLITVQHGIGLVAAVAAYAYYVTGVRDGVARVLGGAIGVFGIATGAQPAYIAIAAAVLVAVSVARQVTGKRVIVSRARPSVLQGRGWPLLQKEWSAVRQYQSDQVFALINTVSAVVMVLVLTDGSIPASRLSNMVTLLSAVAALPFVRVLFNLFGTDANVLPEFARVSALTVAYEMKRLRAYSMLIYGIDAVLGAYAAVRLGYAILPEFCLVAVAFTELLRLMALAYSVWLFERKPILYSYGYNFTSVNVRFIGVAVIALGALVGISWRAAGAAGPLALVVIAAVMEHTIYPDAIAKWLASAPKFKPARMRVS